MKWLFAILVALNIVVFAGIVGLKVLRKPAPEQVQIPAPIAPQAPQVIINTGNTSAIPNATPSSGSTNARPVSPRPVVNAPAPKTANPIAKPQKTETIAEKSPENSTRSPRACSARVSIPEDDYHRIKGLLARYPHAATRQVTEDGGRAQSRMNVVFMSVSEQEAAAIQSVVGRYGHLNRAACDK